MNEEIENARWPFVGSLLSFMVPGFGLWRAGMFRRAVLWFVAIHVVAVFGKLLAAKEFVPTWIAIVLLCGMMLLPLASAIDSWRPGRLRVAHIGLFIAALVWLSLLNVGTSRFIAQPFKIPTGAMQPTLMGSSASAPDQVISDKTAYWFSDPKRGDLGIFTTNGIRGLEINPRYPGPPQIWIKRVVGLPGEIIEIRGGRIYANGNLLDFDHGIPPITYTQNSMKPEQVWDVPESTFFVLGDNSPNSLDSRFWGFVPRENFVGKVTRIYWPLSRVGKPTYTTEDER